MRKLILLLLFVPLALGAQDIKHVPRTVNSKTTARINETIDAVNNYSDSITDHRTELDALGDSITDHRTDITALQSSVQATEDYHMFIYFGDSTVSLSYSTSWAHFTNATDSIFIQYELDGFTVSGDTITITNGGDYVFQGKLTHDGDNGETVSARFFNVTQTAGIPVAGAQTMRAANNFGSTPIQGYYDITAGDKVVLQYRGDANGTAVFKNGSILIYRLHE